jgi:hypothetical protein
MEPDRGRALAEPAPAGPPGRRRRGDALWERVARGSGGGRARGILRLWLFWDRFSALFLHTRVVPGSPHGILHVRFVRHRGRPIALPDGTAVRRGDRICELHLNGPALARLPHWWHVLRAVGDELGALARWAEHGGLPADVHALYGYTLLGRAGPRLGFVVREHPRTLLARFDRPFLLGLMAIYGREGVDRLRAGSTFGRYPQEVWMSRGMLLARYGGAMAAPGATDGSAPPADES